MKTPVHLLPEEYLSLAEVAKGINQKKIPSPHRDLRLSRELIYILLGDLRITTAGRAMLANGQKAR